MLLEGAVTWGCERDLGANRPPPPSVGQCIPVESKARVDAKAEVPVGGIGWASQPGSLDKVDKKH